MCLLNIKTMGAKNKNYHETMQPLRGTGPGNFLTRWLFPTLTPVTFFHFQLFHFNSLHFC